MSFNTLEFAVFFAVFFVLYWFVTRKSLRWQNWLVLIASYVFYGSWDWRFLLLIFVSSAVDFTVGLRIGATEDERQRKYLLWVSLAVNLGMLAFFKYFNFFIDNVNGTSSLLGIPLDWPTRNVILPVGISFYTLQTLSYTFDIYKRKLKPTTDAVAFFAYVSFFPQLVAGPIERATHLLPQFLKERKFSYAGAADGSRQVAWGLFMKMVIADNAGPFVDQIYLDPFNVNWISLILCAILGVMQLYCDFAGYSNIAIGTARIFGFDIMKNFDYPLFARNISEFWQKWHISLITWFRDYVIVWLKGRTKGKLFRNVMVIFLITGLWHGADWRYIIWGAMNALLFIPLIFVKRKKHRKPVGYGRVLPSWEELRAMIWVFVQFALVGMMFRGFSLNSSLDFYDALFTFNLEERLVMPPRPVWFTVPFLMIEWWQRDQNHGLDFSHRDPGPAVRWTFYFTVITITLLYGGEASEFIYFQF